MKEPQVATEEPQPSLFAFRSPKPKRFPRLSFFAQDIIEHLIKQPSTAEEIAATFWWEYDAVIETLRELRDLGLVAVADGSVDGDVTCSDDACDWDNSDGIWAAGDTCPICGADLSDVCRWRYFGGPISEFFKYIQSKGMRDGIHG